MGVGIKCAQLILFIINLLFLLCGAAMIIIGAVAFSKQDTMFHLTGITNGAAIFLIVVGCILVLVALFGCIGAWNKNHCMLVTYCVILCILFIVVLIVIIVAFVVKDKITDDIIRDDLKKTIISYDQNQIIQGAWDGIQADNKCCGGIDFYDWRLNVALNKTESVPDSCCVTQAKNCGLHAFKTPSTRIYTKGCGKDLVEFTKNNFLMIGIIAIIAAIILFFGIIISGCLAHQIRAEYDTV